MVARMRQVPGAAGLHPEAAGGADQGRLLVSSQEQERGQGVCVSASGEYTAVSRMLVSLRKTAYRILAKALIRSQHCLVDRPRCADAFLVRLPHVLTATQIRACLAQAKH